MLQRRLARFCLVLVILLALSPASRAEPPANPAAPVPVANGGEVQPVSSGGSYLLACGDATSGSFTTVSGSYVEVLACILTVPRSGNALIFASTSAGLVGASNAYTGSLTIEVDHAAEPEVERLFSVGPNQDDGTDRAVGISYTRYLTAGAHRIALVVKYLSGSEGVHLTDPTLAAVYIPTAGPVKLADQYRKGIDFTGTGGASVAQQVISNTLSAPGPGWIFISADMGLYYGNGTYDAGLNLALDTIGLETGTYRFISIDGYGPASKYKTVSYTALRPIEAAGTHTVTLLAARFDDPVEGNLRLQNVTLSAAFIPAASGIVTSTGLFGNQYLAVTSSLAMQDIRQIPITVANDTWVLVTADAYLTAETSWVEGHFCLAIDRIQCSSETDRYVDVVPGSYEGLALNYLVHLDAGEHVIRLKGARTTDAGTPGTLRVNKTSLTAIIPGGRLALPLVKK